MILHEIRIANKSFSFMKKTIRGSAHTCKIFNPFLKYTELFSDIDPIVSHTVSQLNSGIKNFSNFNKGIVQHLPLKLSRFLSLVV